MTTQIKFQFINNEGKHMIGKKENFHSKILGNLKKAFFIKDDSKDSENSEEKSYELVEVLASAICTKASINVYKHAAKHMEPWVIVLQEGGIIHNFGAEVDHLVENVRKSYLKRCGVFKNTEVFKQREELLVEEILFCLQIIFEKQVRKLKELSFRIFNEMLSKVPITEKVENAVKATIKISSELFCQRAAFLKPRKTSMNWSYEKEINSFKESIRQTATEKLQMARLQGIYLKKSKNPINLSFHYLHPHPFGKDSRLDSLSSDDSVNYNSQLAKKAWLMRQTASQKDFSSSLPETKLSDELVYQDDPMKSYENGSK